jgi:hypothetical protein
MACIRLSSNLTFNDGLQSVLRQQMPTTQRLMSLTSSSALSWLSQGHMTAAFRVREERSPRIDGKEISTICEYTRMTEKEVAHRKAHLRNRVAHPTMIRIWQRLPHFLVFDRAHMIP